MQEKHTQTFQFGKDDEDHNEIMHLELQDLKLEKLGQRVTLLTVLIPCMIGIILIIAYLDIKDRVTRSQDTGTIGVQKLSRDVESKFSSLSLEQAKTNDTLSKLPSLESASALLKSRLGEVQGSLKKLEASAIDRDELKRVVEKMDERFNTIPADLKTETQNLKSASQQTAEQLKGVSDELKQISRTLASLSENAKRLDEKLSQVESQKVSKNELDLALRLKEIAAKQGLLEATAALEKKVAGLEKQIQAVKKTIGSVSDKSPPGGATPSEKAEAPTVQNPEPAEEAAPQPETKPAAQAPSPQPAPGRTEGIVEQNIE